MQYQYIKLSISFLACIKDFLHCIAEVAWAWDLTLKKGKLGGTSADRYENGQMDVWR